jgi:type I restriction enzyme, R subunit
MMSKAVIVFLGADPDDKNRLRLDEEVRAIEAQLRKGEFRDSLELRTRWATRPDDLLGSLNADGPAVVHFGGHGDDTDGLAFHDDYGGVQTVSGSELLAVFGVASPRLRLVVLNACNTACLAAAIAKVVDCCIGMNDEVSDTAARIFAGAFYRAIAFGKSVANAFRQGQIALRLAGTGEESIPVLLTRHGVNPDSVLITRRSPSAAPRERWIVTFDGKVTEFDLPAQENVAVALMSATGDQELRIERLASGSVRLVVNTTAEGGRTLVSLVGSEPLKSILGFAIIDARPLGQEAGKPRFVHECGGPELEHVEQPFIDQLIRMGWKWTTGNLDFPSATGRSSFRDVLLHDDLKQALRRINRDDHGNDWLDVGRIATAVSAIERLAPPKLMEANQAATELLLKGATVEGVPGWDQGRNQTVQYIDWDHPENNTFRVVNQFRVDEPGGQARKFVVPDLVLFVNGIPLAVVECKSPGVQEPVEEAIDQLQRYANQRSWVTDDEGNERLFHTNQFVIATSYDEARVATVGAQAVHYLEWKDTSPVPMADVAAALGKGTLSSQEKLVAGMLRPEHLLDLVRHFTLFMQAEGRTIKVVARYQQFRAVQKAIGRLLTGKTRQQDGEHDRRGGIVWHTQGSGKSLTMVFLVRKMRTMPALRRFKVVVITDRKTLQKQLAETAALTGETVKKARSSEKLKDLLAEKGPGLVFATIQKYQQRDRDTDADVDTPDVASDSEAIPDVPEDMGEFPVLNEDESILVLVDEAHRSHASALHANLLKALPNCARIGFTGTPILMGAKRRTHEIFGDFIDRYGIKQSEEDGATVPILYEGRTTEGAVADGRDLDDVFEDMFRERTPEELERIKAKYATKGHVMEAPALIEAKARNMLRHYVDAVLPNGFKAQVVAVSRRATLRYREAFLKAREELVGEIERLDPALLARNTVAREALPERTQFLLRGHGLVGLIKDMEFAPIISGSNNDPGEWKEWTDEVTVEKRIAGFKKPFPTSPNDDPKKTSRLAVIIVKSMLLTGFDAPVEQAMYLDRFMHQHELLQAIARVNRTATKKSAGLVVDYFGIARHLKEALVAYSAEDVEGALQSLKDEIPKLRDRHHRVVALFTDKGVEHIEDTEVCVELLRDERLRAEFTVKLKSFLSTLDLVLPRPEALPFVKDARTLTFIQTRARNLYRTGGRPIGKEVGEKVRALIDEHVISLGIDPSIPPISIMDADFGTYVEKQGSPRAKASEMEHAVRYHIRTHYDEDPEHFEKLSERLAKILTDLKDRWDELVEALRTFVAEVEAGRQRDTTGLDPETQAPFLGVLRQEIGGGVDLPPDRLMMLCQVTIELVEHIQQEIRLVGFWENAYAQDVLSTLFF